MTEKKSAGGKSNEPQPIAINGFQQVLEMLKAADPDFRESLLNRLATRDRDLVKSLRKDLAQMPRPERPHR